MDQEFDLLNKNNQKYLIKIDDDKAKLRAMNKLIQNEYIAVC